jgi:hypothetical protein
MGEAPSDTPGQQVPLPTTAQQAALSDASTSPDPCGTWTFKTL